MDWGIGDTYSILLTFIKLDVFIFVQKGEWFLWILKCFEF